MSTGAQQEQPEVHDSGSSRARGQRVARNHVRILIADDDDEVRDKLEDFLTIEGFATDVVENGAQAIHRLAQGPTPDLVIVDVHMPVMSGWAVIDWIEAQPASDRVPVIVFTGTGLTQGAFGLHPVVVKGAEPATLLRKICDVLGLAT